MVVGGTSLRILSTEIPRIKSQASNSGSKALVPSTKDACIDYLHQPLKVMSTNSEHEVTRKTTEQTTLMVLKGVPIRKTDTSRWNWNFMFSGVVCTETGSVRTLGTISAEVELLKSPTADELTR